MDNQHHHSHPTTHHIRRVAPQQIKGGHKILDYLRPAHATPLFQPLRREILTALDQTVIDNDRHAHGRTWRLEGRPRILRGAEEGQWRRSRLRVVCG
jgi:hypothetical protein